MAKMMLLLSDISLRESDATATHTRYATYYIYAAVTPLPSVELRHMFIRLFRDEMIIHIAIRQYADITHILLLLRYIYAITPLALRCDADAS